MITDYNDPAWEREQQERRDAEFETQSIPCITEGCLSKKLFSGLCNDCRREAEKGLPPIAVNPYAGMSWVEEQMAKQGGR